MSNKIFINQLNTDTQLVDRQTAAEFLGVKKNTLTLWAMRKKPNLPYIKLGRLVRYRLSDLEAFLETKYQIENQLIYGVDYEIYNKFY